MKKIILLTMVLIGFCFASYCLPVPGYTTLSAGFNTPRPYGLHMSLDIICPQGSTVCATVSGKVYKTGYDSTLGNYIKIKDDRGHTHVYAHLFRIYRLWDGDEVTAGQKIAESGNTGASRGAHLHYAEFDEHGIPVKTTFFFGISWKLFGDIYAYQSGQ